MEDKVAELLSELKDHMAEMSSEERREVFAELIDAYCVECGDVQPCYCAEEYDE